MASAKIVALFAIVGCTSCVSWGLEHPCNEVVGLLATDFAYRVPSSQLSRVEIRRCNPDDSSTIQLVAWRSGEKEPSLVINTDDFGVVQTVARANIFVIETGGATRDQVFVIAYTEGEPKLVLKRVTKGTARVDISESAIDLLVEGIYAGDNPPRNESQHFTLDKRGMKGRSKKAD